MAIARNSLLLGIATGVAGTLAVLRIAGDGKTAEPAPPSAPVKMAMPVQSVPPGAIDSEPDHAAEYPSTYEIDDEPYTLAKSANGAALTSLSGKKIYLDRSCLIRSDMFGKGRWEWAEYALILMFENREHTFPSREPPVANTDCRWQGNR